MSEKYFVASNSGDGFCSYYDGAFDRKNLNRIYVIKGGSGTGKAFFMKNVATEAEKRGMSVRYIYCSSDAHSLDGIIINEMKTAVLDGTSPHVFEPQAVGAIEAIIDLGAFLDEKKLIGCRAQVEGALAEKSRGFSVAYKYLAAYKKISLAIEELVTPCVNIEKLRDYIEKFSENAEKGSGKVEHLLTRSIGMRGLCDFDTYRERAKIYYRINDCFDTAHILLRELFSALSRRNVDVRVSNNPIIPERLDALCVTSQGLVFEINNEIRDGARTINMKRFVDVARLSEIRGEYRAAAKARDEVLSLAVSAFEKIKKYHFVLEDIYGSAMDFAAKEQFTEHFCKKIFQNN